MIKLLKFNASKSSLKKKIVKIIYNDLIKALSQFTSEEGLYLKSIIDQSIIKIDFMYNNDVKMLLFTFDNDFLEDLYSRFSHGVLCIKVFCDFFEKNWNNKEILLIDNYYNLATCCVSDPLKYMNLLSSISFNLDKLLEIQLGVPNPTFLSMLSGQSYEKNESKESIVCGYSSDNIDFDFKYNIPIPFTLNSLRQCRKALEVAYTKKRNENDPKKVVFLTRNKDNWYIYGLVSEEKVKHYPQITFNGKLSWVLTFPEFDGEHQYVCNKKVIQYKNGLYGYPAESKMKDSQIENFKNLFPGNYNKLWEIAKAVEAAGKGTTIVFTDDSEEIERIKKQRLGTSIQKINLYDMIDSGNKTLENLCSVDGAVIVNERAECECFAVILDGNSVIEGDPSTGSRHNSAKNYIALKKKTRKKFRYIAVVVSDDSYTEVYQ